MPTSTMEEINNYLQEKASSELQSFSTVLEANLKKFQETILERNEQISALSKEVSMLRESLKKALKENKAMKITIGQKELKIKQFMKTNYQLQMETDALTGELGSVRKEKESVDEELYYTLEELEAVRSDPSETTKNLEDTIKKLEERNGELEKINKANNPEKRLKKKDTENSELKKKL